MVSSQILNIYIFISQNIVNPSRNRLTPMTQRLQQLQNTLVASKSEKTPIRVTVTGAAGNIGYALVFMIGQGRFFGPSQPVHLTLLEVPAAQNQMKATIMELNDSVYPLLASIRGATTYDEGFKDCELAILVGAKPRGPGMERKDLLGQNAAIFRDQGKAINTFANKNCRVVVVGNPANTNCMIASKFAPNIPRANFSALTRLDENRAVHQLSEKLGVPSSRIENMIIWGNHSPTMVPDYQNAVVEKTAGVRTPVETAVNDKAWLDKTFIEKVQKRGAEVISLRKLSSAASAASAICDHVYTLYSNSGKIHSMAVMSNGEYGIDKDICFSFPVICSNGSYKIVEGFNWSPEAKKRVDVTLSELREEREMSLKAVS